MPPQKYENYNQGKSIHLKESKTRQETIPASGNVVSLPDWMTVQMYCSWKPLFVKAWDKLKLPRTSGQKLTMTIALFLQKRHFVSAAIVVALCNTAKFKSRRRAEAREALDAYFAGTTRFPFTAKELKELATPQEAYNAIRMFEYKEA